MGTLPQPFDFSCPAAGARLPLHGLLGGVRETLPAWVWALLLLAILVSITVHEFGHAWMADRLGDPGPRAAGRVTLNPLAHLDPLGTLLMVVTTIFGFPVGWGKPVKTDPDLYRVDRRLGIALVAGAGPAMNFLTAVLLSPIARYILWGGHDTPLYQAVFFVTAVVMIVNLGLFVFNLLPLYPLDGSHITQSLLPEPAAKVYGRFMKKYGVFLFLGLMLTGFIGEIVGPTTVKLFLWLLGVPT
jgi:Zn-dependent protease